MSEEEGVFVVITKQLRGSGAATLLLALATILALVISMYTSMLAEATGSTTEVITGDTSVASSPGWLFNADPGYVTPFEFNSNMPSIGNGSLEVFPIGSNPNDKMIASYIEGSALSDVSSIAYDFKIGGSGDETDANEFYLNVYTIASSTPASWYDCRFDYVPTTGSTSAFTTYSVDMTDAATEVVKNGSYAGACPSSPSEMPDGSILIFFSINLGDTTDTDEGVGGFFDNVVVERTAGTTVYDFEPEEEYFTLNAQKVVCVAEEFLPNWGNGASNITDTTAETFVLDNEEVCQIVDWEFQWRDEGGNPGDAVGEADSPWETFGSEAIISTLDAGDDKRIWVREVYDDSWVPFSGANKTQDYSAEFYCHDDVLNYDNYDYVRNIAADETYYCVGFNAPAVQDCEVGNVFFQIGQDEETQLDNPADEFSWNGVNGDWSRPMDDPFVVPFSPDERFPWNTNVNKGQATDFDVRFYVAEAGVVPEAVLNVGWAPGNSGTETKEIFLDGEMIATVTREGASVGGWYNNMEVFDEQVELGHLEEGWHTLTFTQTSGDGTLWDYVNVEVSNCDWTNQIQGRKIVDVNGDGELTRQERRNNRLNGWPIYLFGSEWGEPIDMMYTGDDNTEAGNVSNGQYRFENLAPGTYYVCEDNGYGWMQTYPGDGPMSEELGTYCHEVVIEGNFGEYNSRWFGNFKLGHVNAWKFLDANRNGELDEGEEYIDWEFMVFNDELEVVYPDDQVTRALQVVDDLVDDVQDDYEPWSMWYLEPGTYTICEYARDGWVQSYPANDDSETVGLQEYGPEFFDLCHYFTIDTSDQEVDVQFGNYPVGAIQGRKYHDVNANGSFDTEERQAEGNVNRLDGWTINLYDTDWLLVDSMVTGDDGTDAGNVGRGQYRFVDVPLGTYYVCEVAQDGWVQSQPEDGPQFEGEGPFCREVVLDEPGELRSGQRFGNYEAVAAVQGLVYSDFDGTTGVQDGADEPLSGWDVYLLTQNSPYTVYDIFTTDATGAYSFDNLPYGRYWICQDLQSNWIQTQRNNAGATGANVNGATIGQVLDLDDTTVGNFCYEVFLDSSNQLSVANDFGNQPPVNGVTISIEPDTGGAVLGATTDDGSVLGAEVLADTGQGIAVSAAIGSITFVAATGIAFISRPRSRES